MPNRVDSKRFSLATFQFFLFTWKVSDGPEILYGHQIKASCSTSVQNSLIYFTEFLFLFSLRTPRSTEGSQGYSQYQWTSPGCKPSSPFIATEKKKEALIELSKPRPGTAEAEIEGKFWKNYALKDGNLQLKGQCIFFVKWEIE